MKRYLHSLTVVLTAIAFLAVLSLLTSDILHRGRPSSWHQNAGAWSLMAIGLAYISAHVRVTLSRAQRMRAMLLGAAFFLWGSEQFVPPSICVTLIDSAVIVIFVIDLGLAIAERLRGKNDREG